MHAVLMDGSLCAWLEKVQGQPQVQCALLWWRSGIGKLQADLQGPWCRVRQCTHMMRSVPLWRPIMRSLVALLVAMPICIDAL